MRQSRIIAVDHVILEAPYGLDDRLRWFYGDLGHLEEVPPAAASAASMCFRSDRIELRIRFTESPLIDPIQTRVTLLVPSLFEAKQLLEEQSIAYATISGFAYTDRRLAILDPAGHRVELKQSWPEVTL